MWILAACASALFAGITSILAKCGIRHTDSDVATAVRTVVVLLFAWLMAALVGSISTIGYLCPLDALPCTFGNGDRCLLDLLLQSAFHG